MEAAHQAGGQHRDIIDRMNLIHGDSITILPHMQADVVLVDPMHPPRQKSALAKAEMRAIRDIVGIDEDQRSLVETRDCDQRHIKLSANQLDMMCL